MNLNPKKILNNYIDKRINNSDAFMQYNPLIVEIEDKHTSSHYTRRMLENSVWYSGIEQDIQYFYRTQAPKFVKKGQQSESLNYFWASEETDIRKIHSGFPQLISEKMVDLIIGNGYQFTVETEDNKNEDELQQELTDALKDNQFKSMLFGKAIETESWSGGVPLKISWNPEISEYPIIEVWQPENYTCEVQSGRITKDIFYIYYTKGNAKYRLNEIYGINEDGAYIDYKLEKLVADNIDTKWEDVPLSELEDTKDLKRITFNGYYKKLSLYKPNKLPNSEFRYSLFGESDYSGSYGAFDAIDEILSTWIQEHRDSKLFRYFPEEFLKKNSDGSYSYPSGFINKHILYEDSPSENVEKQKIQYAQGELRIDKHVESYKSWVTQALNNAGLSPLTVGVTGLESIDASAQSQQEREKVSIRTRNKKAELWKEYLEKFLKIYLEFRYITKNMTQNMDQTYSIDNIPEFNIIVTFNDYIIKSKADRTQEVMTGFGTSWDVLEAVKYVHTDKTQREQLAISARIKVENGYNSISQAEVAALQSENEDTAQALKDMGIEVGGVNAE